VLPDVAILRHIGNFQVLEIPSGALAFFENRQNFPIQRHIFTKFKNFSDFFVFFLNL